MSMTALAVAGDTQAIALARNFAERFRLLRATVYPVAQGRPYRIGEISEGITAQGYPVSRTYIGMMLDNRRAKQPNFYLVDAIAHFFGVDLSYFSAQTPDWDAADLMDKAARFGAFLAIAERAELLGLDALQYVLEVLNREVARQDAASRV
jgi:hypothetical protein